MGGLAVRTGLEVGLEMVGSSSRDVVIAEGLLKICVLSEILGVWSAPETLTFQPVDVAVCKQLAVGVEWARFSHGSNAPNWCFVGQTKVDREDIAILSERSVGCKIQHGPCFSEVA